MVRMSGVGLAAALAFLLAGCGGHSLGPVAPSAAAVSSIAAPASAAAAGDAASRAVSRATADTWLDQASPATNHGTDTLLLCGNSPDGRRHRDLLRFDLSQVPPDADLQRATLSLYVAAVDGSPDQYRVHRAMRPWTETAATWTANAAAYRATASATVSIGAGDAGSVVSVDITDLAKDWLAHPARNYGCLIRGTEGAARLGATFASRESETDSHRPALKLEWAAAFYAVSDRCAYGTGGRVAFASFGGNGLRYLYAMDEALGWATLLTPSHSDPARSDEGGFHPAFSPDGTQIAFTSRRPVTGDVASNDLYIIPAAGGEMAGLTRLTTDAGSDDMPSYSPDGAQITFSSDRTGTPSIYVMDADGSDEHAVTTGAYHDQWPCFNPRNPNQIAFSSDRAGVGNTDLYVLHLSDGKVTQVTTSASREEAPSWSPDGSRILFHSNQAGDFDIWSIRPDGTGQVQVTSGADSDGYPSWRTPDGGRFVFTRNRQVWTARPNGSDQHQLTRTF